jgi:predicted nucleic acid-binding protein
MIILDTNVLSALMRDHPDEAVVKWLDQQPRLSIWTTSITILEIQFGIAIISSGTRQRLLGEAFDKAINEKLERRVAAFDTNAAQAAAVFMSKRQQKGRPSNLRDAMIAGIALSHRATLATRKTHRFEDLTIPIVNPWEFAG